VKEDAWYLAGHFPGNPIMPGVLQVEALAQVGAICGLAHPEFAGRLALFAGIDDVRFKRIVRPGDILDLRCEISRLRGPVGRAEAEATVEGELACRGALTFALVEGELP
jgi:3-hydroxyacyl-[acyl-carrier-protein] dehydratase